MFSFNSDIDIHSVLCVSRSLSVGYALWIANQLHDLFVFDCELFNQGQLSADAEADDPAHDSS